VGKRKGAKDKAARIRVANKRVRLLPRTATPICAFALSISGIFLPVDLFFRTRLCSQDLNAFWESVCHCTSGLPPSAGDCCDVLQAKKYPIGRSFQEMDEFRLSPEAFLGAEG
jgi:hypothetical protein